MIEYLNKTYHKEGRLEPSKKLSFVIDQSDQINYLTCRNVGNGLDSGATKNRDKGRHFSNRD